MDKVKIYFPIICYNHSVLCHFMFSTIRLSNEAMMNGVQIIFDCIYFDSLIPRARNAAAAGFLNHPTATHLLFIDSDISFLPKDVLSMLRKDKEVICGLYPKKAISNAKLNHVSKIFNDLPENYESLCTDFASETPTKGDFETLKYAATGFMLIKKSAFTKIIEKFPNIRYKNDVSSYNKYGDNFYDFFPCGVNQENKKYESEDYGFSRLWRETGGEIFVDKSINLTHYGWKGYQGDVLGQINIFNPKD